MQFKVLDVIPLQTNYAYEQIFKSCFADDGRRQLRHHVLNGLCDLNYFT